MNSFVTAILMRHRNSIPFSFSRVSRNDDGALDILTGGILLYVYESDGGYPPTFTRTRVANFPNGGVTVASVADVDSDGDKDVVFSTYDQGVKWGQNTLGYRFTARTPAPVNLTMGFPSDVTVLLASSNPRDTGFLIKGSVPCLINGAPVSTSYAEVGGGLYSLVYSPTQAFRCAHEHLG
jgi:hypothetical protein